MALIMANQPPWPGSHLHGVAQGPSPEPARDGASTHGGREHALAYLNVHVTPGARKNELAGWQGTALKVKVRAPPEKGKANEAVCALIARSLGLPARSILVERGHTSRGKLLLVDGLEEDEMLRRLGAPML